jgi:N-acetylneuraminic acid mutarotase
VGVFVRHALLVGLALLTIGSAFATEPARRTLTFEDRVRAQEAIEQVYWSRRIWPKENPGPKPPLSAAISGEAIRAKVEDYLRKSNALEKVWQRPIAAEQLQAEMDRMSEHTKDRETLQDLYRALGNDAALIAETLARQTLAERLIRNWYVNDSRFHGALKATAEAALAACATADCMKSMPGEYREITWKHSLDRAELSTDGSRATLLQADEWSELLGRLAKAMASTPDAIPTRRLSSLEETPEAFVVKAVLTQHENEITVATVTWPKRSFDTWWGAERGALDPWIAAPSGEFVLPAAALAACVNDSWVPTRFEVPDPRFNQTVVWTGTEMIVWGGNGGGNGTSIYLRTGGRYNPSTDSWTVTSMGTDVPSAREQHTAVWTGTEMIVWGGWNGSADLGSGGRYNPATDTWTATSAAGVAPGRRRGHSAIWTGSRMIVWGGTDGPYFNTGGRYDPSTDSWTATSTGANVPTTRTNHTAVWTGSEMIVWGGQDPGIANSGGRYDPVADTWTPTSTGTGVPSARSEHSVVWTGTEMIVWGGSASNTGGRYNPSTNTWTATSTGASVPTARSYHTAVWTGTEMIVWGGYAFPDAGNTGGRYNPVTNTWKRTSTGANVPTPRQDHTAVWTGTEMIVWGGDQMFGVNTGGRYDAATDSWVATSNGAQVPAARSQHAAVWTGTEMIVWGGDDGYGSINTGGRYVPSTDSSTPTSTGADVPAARASSGAVWTGTHMIVWGGYDSRSVTYLNTGGRYSPLTDSWSPTSTGTDVPAGRYSHTLLWTGSTVIAWGGYTGSNYVDSGGCYDPSTDSWTQISTGANVPDRRTSHTAVWTGSEMIVWGGYGFSGSGGATALDTGGRYNPITDTWTPTSLGTNVPAGRSAHTAVWTGTEMIVWGGTTALGYSNGGGRYSPSTDAWAPTSTEANIPVGRNRPTSVWTGKEMIVWGGSSGSLPYLNTGGRYDPSTDMWVATSIGANVPSGRFLHTAVWTGTEMVVWGGSPTTSSGGRYCACPDGRIYYRDADGDGYGDTGVGMPSCDGTVPSGYVSVGLDCDDSDASVHPGGIETCNGVDDNCNELVDESASAEDFDHDTVHDLCDNCLTTWNPVQSDFDHDGEGDACDVNDGLIYVYAADKNYRAWQAESGYTTWNSYRGSLAVLRATGQYTQAPGSNPLAARDCGLSDPYVFDLLTPNPGEVAFNLVTGVTGGVESGLGTNSGGSQRPNANPCP